MHIHTKYLEKNVTLSQLVVCRFYFYALVVLKMVLHLYVVIIIDDHLYK